MIVNLLPLEKSQLNKPLVNVKGTVSDTSSTVKVNGIKAIVHPDGTWAAKDVRVSPSGAAIFNIEVLESNTSE